MSLLPFLFDLVSRSDKPIFSFKTILGYFLMAGGFGVGLLTTVQLLYPFLYPFMGFYGANLFLCAVSIGLGLIFTHKKHEKKIDYAETIKDVGKFLPTTDSIYSFSKDHKKQILGAALVLGFFLSQCMTTQNKKR